MTFKRLLVSRKGLRELGIPLCPTEIDRKEKAGKFPRRIKLSEHRAGRVVWRYDEVVAWIEERAAQTKPLSEDDDLD